MLTDDTSGNVVFKTNFLEYFFYLFDNKSYAKYYALLDDKTYWLWGLPWCLHLQGFNCGLINNYCIKHFYVGTGYADKISPRIEYADKIKKFGRIPKQLKMEIYNFEIIQNDKPPTCDDKIDSQCDKIIDLNDNITKTEKSVIIVPFDKLVATNEQAHNFLINYYCCDEYKKYTIAKTETTNHVEEFLDTSSKKFLFNMHYINRINMQKFVSVFEYSVNDNAYYNKVSAVNRDGLGFITVHTNKVFTYQIYDQNINNVIFDELFVFEWLNNAAQNCDWLCNSMQKLDLFTKFSNPMFAIVTVYYLRIMQRE